MDSLTRTARILVREHFITSMVSGASSHRRAPEYALRGERYSDNQARLHEHLLRVLSHCMAVFNPRNISMLSYAVAFSGRKFIPRYSGMKEEAYNEAD